MLREVEQCQRLIAHDPLRQVSGTLLHNQPDCAVAEKSHPAQRSDRCRGGGHPQSGVWVLTGVLIASLNFATKVACFMAVSSVLKGETRTYTVTGQVFFASADRFIHHFDFHEALDRVVIDVSLAHFWDITSVSVLNRIVIKFRRKGADVDVRGMNGAIRTLVDRFGVHDKPEEVEKLMGSR